METHSAKSGSDNDEYGAVRREAREAALRFIDSRFNTGQRGALEHAADAASDVWRRFIAGQEGVEVTLCHVCGEPVWPSFSLYQRPDEGRRIVFGHERCLNRDVA